MSKLWTKLGAVTPLGAIPLLDYLIITSDSVGRGVEQEARYFRLVGAPFVIDIKQDEDPVTVFRDRWHNRRTNGPIFRPRPAFDGSWKPEDFERVNAQASAKTLCLGPATMVDDQGWTAELWIPFA